MLIRYGYEISLLFPQKTPLVILMDVHHDRRNDILNENRFISRPEVHEKITTDFFGNRSRKIIAPGGSFKISLEGCIKDGGMPDPLHPTAQEIPVQDLPPEALFYLAGSRYCETDKLCQMAWDMFGQVEPGWSRVQAICDYVHDRLRFGYQYARCTRTAAEANFERKGVCRDFTHLAVALCRAMNIPARYVNGYMGDIGVPENPAPMDFNAWFEAYLDGQWHTFDARHNERRIGRIVIARGRDAADVPMINSFGQHEITSFKVVTEEVSPSMNDHTQRQKNNSAFSHPLPAELPFDQSAAF